MTIKFDRVKTGDILYSVYRQKMGHTTMSGTVCKAITITAIDEDGRGATGTSNGVSRHYSLYQIERLRRTPVETTLQQMARMRRES